MTREREAEHGCHMKRLAAQILAQLPENQEEALAVLTLARELVLWETASLVPALKVVG